MMLMVCLTSFRWIYVADMFSFLSFLTVLTKVVVYVGIGIMAHTIVPAMFEALEWGI